MAERGDSDPCGVVLKRFSRPPRYDRFDIPACARCHYTSYMFVLSRGKHPYPGKIRDKGVSISSDPFIPATPNTAGKGHTAGWRGEGAGWRGGGHRPGDPRTPRVARRGAPTRWRAATSNVARRRDRDIAPYRNGTRAWSTRGSGNGTRKRGGCQTRRREYGGRCALWKKKKLVDIH